MRFISNENWPFCLPALLPAFPPPSNRLARLGFYIWPVNLVMLGFGVSWGLLGSRERFHCVTRMDNNNKYWDISRKNLGKKGEVIRKRKWLPFWEQKGLVPCRGSFFGGNSAGLYLEDQVLPNRVKRWKKDQVPFLEMKSVGKCQDK